MYIKPQTNIIGQIALQILAGKPNVKIQQLKPSNRRGVRLDKVSSNSLGVVKDRSLATKLRMNGVLK